MAGAQDFSGFISGLANAYKRSQILFTALNGGVFAQLETPRTTAEVAAACGWSPRGAAMLLDGLVAVELVVKSNDTYQNTPAASECLVPGKPAWQGEILRHTQASWEAWSHLDDRVRTGTCGAGSEEERSGDVLRDFILGMQNIAQFSAGEVLGAVDLSKYRHMLDLAGGPATYPIAFLKAHPHLQATLFDRPPVIEIAREQVAAAGLESRFTYIAGDCMTSFLGGPYDLVFMSNIIHSFSKEENLLLVKKAFDALEPGGALIIKDFITEDDRSGPAFSLIFALHMLVHTPAGGTYSFAEIKDWTTQAGFEPGYAVALTPQTRLWIANRPHH